MSLRHFWQRRCRRRRRRRGSRRGIAARLGAAPAAAPAAAAPAGALEIELPVVAVHHGLRAGQLLDVLAAAGVIEMVVAEDQVLDLLRVELQLLHRRDDDVLRVILAVHRVEQDVAVVRRDQPRADAGIADPVEVVEQPLAAEDLRRARRRERRELRLAVGHADGRAVGILRAARRLAEDPEVEHEIGIVAGDAPSPCRRTPSPWATSPPTVPRSAKSARRRARRPARRPGPGRRAVAEAAPAPSSPSPPARSHRAPPESSSSSLPPTYFRLKGGNEGI